MAWSENKIAGNYNTPTREYICDSAADLNALPENAPHGSTAFVIENSEVYMKKSNGTWKKL